MVYGKIARTVRQFLKLFLQVASTCFFCKLLVEAVFPDSSSALIAVISIILLKVVDAILLLCSVEDRAAVHWCVVVPDVEEGAARVEFVFVVEGEDAREFKLIVPADSAVGGLTRVAPLKQVCSCYRYFS